MNEFADGFQIIEPQYPLEEVDDNEIIGTADTIAELIADLCTDTLLQGQLGTILDRFTSGIHYAVLSLDKNQARITDRLRMAQEDFDGSEVADTELQDITSKAQTINGQIAALEVLRDRLAECVLGHTGRSWQPHTGSKPATTCTAAVIEARDYLSCLERERDRAHAPQGTLIAFSGARDYTNTKSIWGTLDKVRAKHADMLLIHGGDRQGADNIAASWASTRKVHCIVCKPDWNANGKSAPFKRNDQIVRMRPLGLIACPNGNGINANLQQKCRDAGIHVHRLPE